MQKQWVSKGGNVFLEMFFWSHFCQMLMERLDFGQSEYRLNTVCLLWLRTRSHIYYRPKRQILGTRLHQVLPGLTNKMAISHLFIYKTKSCQASPIVEYQWMNLWSVWERLAC